MSPRSKSELTFCAAYGGSPHSDGALVRSTIASFMAIEELGGLLGPLDGEDNGDESQHRAESGGAESENHDSREKTSVHVVDLESADPDVSVPT